MPKIRPATIADLAPMTTVWNQTVGEVFPLTSRLFFTRTEGDPDFSWEYSFVAEEANEVVGFILGTRSTSQVRRPGNWGNSGWVKLMAVLPQQQRRGIGSVLLQTSESALTATGGIQSIAAGADPYHFFPGPPDELPQSAAFLEKHGYTISGSAWDVMRDVTDYVVPEKVIKLLAEVGPQMQVVNCTDEKMPALCEFLTREFPGGWHYYTRVYLGGGARPDDFLIILDEDHVEGFCHTTNFARSTYLGGALWHPLLGDNWGALGPIGISASLRGKGMGLALLAQSVAYLREQGVSKMVIDWTGLLDFYGILGFKPWKRYQHANKSM